MFILFGRNKTTVKNQWYSYMQTTTPSSSFTVRNTVGIGLLDCRCLALHHLHFDITLTIKHCGSLFSI